MLADYNFYKNEYKGIVFADDKTYEYFGERASDELALYSNRRIFSTDSTAQTQLKKCACRIADILFASTNNGKMDGKIITSESVAGYYSVSYSVATDSQINLQINSAISSYIGRYILGVRAVKW